MERLEFAFHFVLSFFIHSLVFFLFFKETPSSPTFTLKKGVVVTTNLVFLKPKNPHSKAGSQNQLSKQETGSLTNEISHFQNSLAYPPLALEHGWETECEWEVEIVEGKIQKWKYLKACSHEIFRKTVEKSFATWTFHSTFTQTLKIPIRFKIQEKD